MESIDLAVVGGRVFHAGTLQELTLGMTDGTVTHLVSPDTDLESEETIHLDGEWVLPGFVDGHIHLREPGYVEKEGIESGTRAAAAGGVTTIVEMPNTTPPVVNVDRLAEKDDRFDRQSHVDYALFGAITPDNVGTGDIAALADAGVTAFKTFMATSFGPLLVDDKGVLYGACENVADTGLPLYIHAEDEEYLTEFGNRAASIEGMDAFFEAKPPIAETTAVADVIDIVAETGVELVVAHVTTAEALERIDDARSSGLPIHAEVTPYHLTFDREAITEIGTVAIGTPPARDAANFEALWEHFEAGHVQLLGSDHAPHTLEEKNREPLDVAPGMPQLETAVPAMLDAIDQGRTTVSRLVDRYAVRPAKLHDLYPRKGTLQPGSDADFVVIDPDESWTVDSEAFESVAAYSPFDGRTLTGRPVAVYQRGRCIADDEGVHTEPGDGDRLYPEAHS